MSRTERVGAARACARPRPRRGVAVGDGRTGIACSPRRRRIVSSEREASVNRARTRDGGVGRPAMSPGADLDWDRGSSARTGARPRARAGHGGPGPSRARSARRRRRGARPAVRSRSRRRPGDVPRGRHRRGRRRAAPDGARPNRCGACHGRPPRESRRTGQRRIQERRRGGIVEEPRPHGERRDRVQPVGVDRQRIEIRRPSPTSRAARRVSPWMNASIASHAVHAPPADVRAA